jgi:DNA (cytosine-5)-methyltransferase 1
MKLVIKQIGIPEKNGHATIDLDNNPSPSIMAQGIGGVGHGQYWIDDADTQTRRHADMNKPPYQVPSMQDIAAIPWNGYKVASTFSGCGGSCTGYRMAGYKVVWANEFVPAAQASYRANMEADCILDCRDVKTVTADEILQATNLQVGELDLFDGSPPCQAFSTAGKREKGWGKNKTYEHGAKQKNETLFDEYIRLLRGLQPKVFVAENVSGLVKGVAKGFFIDILAALKDCGYTVKAKLLDAQWLGVPQMRQRIIFVGVRNDLQLEPVHPEPLKYRYSVRDALPWIEKAEHDTSGLFSLGDITDRPCPTVTIGVNAINSYHYKVEERMIEGANGYNHHAQSSDRDPMPTVQAGRPVSIETQTEKRKFTIAELLRICAFPDDFILTGSYAQQWERLGNSVPPVMMYHIASKIKSEILDKVAVTA